MGCRIGIATDVADRVQKLKQDGIVPSFATYKTISSNLTYEDANAQEKKLRDDCGAHCQGRTGGGHVSGNKWFVYRIDW